MSSAAEGTRDQATINPRLLRAIDRLLIAGIKLGPARKHKAINKILQLVPTWTRGDCWRRIRQLRRSELAGLAQTPLRDKLEESPGVAAVRRAPSRPWIPADDDKLLNWAGYEPVKKIAQRLGRSVRAVRFRLGALGMSAKVTDGWSQRGLRTLLRVSPARLRYLIGNAMLRVRDSRITSSSLAALCAKSRPSMDPSTIERLTAAIAKDDAHSWERAAGLLGVTF